MFYNIYFLSFIITSVKFLLIIKRHSWSINSVYIFIQYLLGLRTLLASKIASYVDEPHETCKVRDIYFLSEVDIIK